MFITLMALCALVVHVFAVVPLVDETRHWPWMWPLVLAVGFMAAELLPVHLRLGREAYAFSMMELPLVVGLFFVRPDLLVVSRVLGSLVAFVIQRKDLQKMAFNWPCSRSRPPWPSASGTSSSRTPIRSARAGGWPRSSAHCSSACWAPSSSVS